MTPTHRPPAPRAIPLHVGLRVLMLALGGVGIRDIARSEGLARNTVRRIVRAGVEGYVAAHDAAPERRRAACARWAAAGAAARKKARGDQCVTHPESVMPNQPE